MAIPLIWLGATVAAVYAGTKLAQEDVRQRGNVKVFPGDCDHPVRPANGAIVCCGIYEVLQHTGIWLDGVIIELKGNGLIRGISPERFLHDRSGDRIYVACDTECQVLCDEVAAERAAQRLYEYSEYHLVNNNCHRFVWQAMGGRNEPLARFAELNQRLSQHFGTDIHWQPARI